jgi:hypothetical protein
MREALEGVAVGELCGILNWVVVLCWGWSWLAEDAGAAVRQLENRDW